MAIGDLVISGVIAEALTEADLKLQEREYPEINIAEAIPVSETLEKGLEHSKFGIMGVRGSLDDGLIGNKTTSLIEVGTDIEFKKAPAEDWAKMAEWNLVEVEKAVRYGVAIDTTRLGAVYDNALATLQKAGYLGHKASKGQEGLLTGADVEKLAPAVDKTLNAMTADEVVTFILDAYDKAYAKSGYTVMPNKIAIDSRDLMIIMGKFSTSVVVGIDGMPFSALDKITAALKKASGNDTFSVDFVKVPMKFAQKVKNATTSRLAVYSYNDAYVDMEVMMPELLTEINHGLMSFQAGYRTRFTGARWKEPESAVYVDYKIST